MLSLNVTSDDVIESDVTGVTKKPILIISWSDQTNRH